MFIQSTLASMPTYSSLFLSPPKVTKILVKLTWDCFWENSHGDGSTPNVNLEITYFPKLMGGMGIWNFQQRNDALVHKWIWRFDTKESGMAESLWMLCMIYSLWVEVARDWFHLVLLKLLGVSFIWLLDLVANHAQHCRGNGTSTLPRGSLGLVAALLWLRIFFILLFILML